ncbi:MAG: dTDP-4-dehydrorhamnose reductase [Rhodobacteraceae bacterium]|nr:dTDP-4-dehydrorhamnose reductase [Paracoccaceae bacterium]
MKVLAFGKTGQVAIELARHVPGGATLIALGRDQADLCDPAACAAAIRSHAPDIVINAAAYTAVDRAEEDEATALRVNGAAPGAMAAACAALGIAFVHISTDYVFDGSGTAPWCPGDPTAPLGAYGRSKLAGEEAVRGAGGRHVILRTSWVFSAHGGNFVKSMLRLSETRDRLSIVADQVGGPTAAADIAVALWTIAGAMVRGTGPSGTYHFAGHPAVSWADFAREIFAQAGRRVEVVKIPASAYPTPAKRPSNSRLDCTALATDFGIEQPDWRKSLRGVISELKEMTL